MVAISPLNRVFDRMVTLSRAMDQTLDSTANGGSASWVPALDASETEQSYLVSVDLPGLSREQVEVNFEKDTLTIHGERAAAQGNGTTRVFFRERAAGRFQRSLRFPQHVEGDKITAEFSNGVLTVTVPKVEAAKARKIEVR